MGDQTLEQLGGQHLLAVEHEQQGHQLGRGEGLQVGQGQVLQEEERVGAARSEQGQGGVDHVGGGQTVTVLGQVAFHCGQQGRSERGFLAELAEKVDYLVSLHERESLEHQGGESAELLRVGAQDGTLAQALGGQAGEVQLSQQGRDVLASVSHQ